MTKPAVAYEAPVYKRPKNPLSQFARLGNPGRVTAKPMAYEVRDGVPLEALERWSCRWPVGKPGAGLFCGCRKAAGRPYCDDHASKARERPVDAREVDRFVDMAMRIAAGVPTRAGHRGTR
jgi:hypothetical protein